MRLKPAVPIAIPARAWAALALPQQSDRRRHDDLRSALSWVMRRRASDPGAPSSDHAAALIVLLFSGGHSLLCCPPPQTWGEAQRPRR